MSTNAQAAEALRSARACILTDRTSMADTGMDPSGAFDPDTATALAEYDAVIQQIDAALAAHEAEKAQAKSERPPSPTAGMNIAQRILHVGGRNNAAGYVEFGSIQAVQALVSQVLRDLPAAPAAPVAAPVLVRDVADMLGTTVAAVSSSFVALGHAPRSTNMAVTGEEAVQVAVHLRAAQAARQGFALVRSPITEAMHAAACKVLARADGLDGTPQRMLDAMLAAQAEPALQWQQMGAESPEQWERFKAWQATERGR